MRTAPFQGARLCVVGNINRDIKTAPFPAGGYDFSPDGWFANFAWDPVHEVFYVSRMGKPAMKFER